MDSKLQQLRRQLAHRLARLAPCDQQVDSIKTLLDLGLLERQSLLALQDLLRVPEGGNAVQGYVKERLDEPDNASISMQPQAC